MPLPNISLAQFNSIAIGKYNAGFVDFATDDQGNLTGELKKVNNHVHSTGKNRAELSPERVLEVKEAFIAALERGRVPQESINQIREQLGIPKEMDATGDQTQLRELATKRFTPLTRQHVRALLDQYADGGRGFTAESQAAVSDRNMRAAQRTANMPESRKATRQEVNRASIFNARVDFKLTDVMSVLSTGRSLASLATGMQNRVAGDDSAADDLRRAAVRDLGSGVATLLSVALGMLPAGIRESEEFSFLGTPVTLAKDNDGKLSAIVGQGAAKTTLRLGFDVDTLVGRLVGRAVRDQDTIGTAAVKEMLNAAYAMDIKKGLMASDRTSLTRHFAALVLESHGKADLAEGETQLVNLAGENYNTGILVQIAQRTLDGQFAGENVLDTKQKLDNYYGQMRKDTASLPDDIKLILEGVANMPIEEVDDGEFIVRAPVVGDIQQHVDAIPPQHGPAPALPQNVSLANVKDFVADFIFSGDTLVSDVVIDQPGELMRRSLSDPKKLAAFAALIKNPDLLDTAAAPQIADVLKTGFAALKAKLDPVFAAANNGVTLDQAAAQPGFADRFAAFLRDANQLPGAVLAEFDDVIDEMAAGACVKMQTFVNEVFNIQGGGGVNVVKDPYSTMSKDQIKAELDGKSLNGILDAAATNAVPGQVGFFKQVVSNYFTSLDQSDKRSCLAAALRYANVFDFAGKEGDALQSAEQAAINKFTGAILKGAGPLLHKMMQGLPKDIMGPYADALEDMKQHLAPIPRKIVQAYLNKIIADSNGKIQSITLEKSLGAASVGEAFLCTFAVKERVRRTRPATLDEMLNNGGITFVPVLDDQGNAIYDDEVLTHKAVVKIMRHDAERRVEKESKIFTAAAQKIPGMAKTWEGQLKQYMTEFDFRTEAQNVQAGVGLYDIKGSEAHPLKAVAPDVTTMKLSKLAPSSKNVLVADVMDGDTVDEYFKTSISEIRTAASSLFQQDPATGRIKWEEKENPVTHKIVKRPLLRADIPATGPSNLRIWLASNQEKLTKASNKLLQATKAWFYNALLGDGKFHGDAHAGNLMMNVHQIGFIDFGNLYTLNKQRDDGVNEQQELLRVILGAAFRDKAIVLKGFDKLMSPEGKARLADPAIREKAEAVLESVLSPDRGRFSFNIVYRLQAAIVELQKLGLELPPQINCFILSLVRLSNSVTEINTIVNQTNAILETSNELEVPAPPDRDDLDYVGRVFDAYASKAGREPVTYRRDATGAYVPVPPGQEQPGDNQCHGYLRLLLSPEFGGFNKVNSNVFNENGDYTNKVIARLNGVGDPLAEGEKLVNTLNWHADPDHSALGKMHGGKALEAFDKFRADLEAAGDNAELKAAAIRTFAVAFAKAQANLLQMVYSNLLMAGNPKKSAPSTFASAITDILFDNFNAVQKAVGVDGLAIYNDARGVVTNELHVKVGFFDGDLVVDTIKADARHEGGDKSYAIDIGV